MLSAIAQVAGNSHNVRNNQSLRGSAVRSQKLSQIASGMNSTSMVPNSNRRLNGGRAIRRRRTNSGLGRISGKPFAQQNG